jgi:hypothetical protein
MLPAMAVNTKLSYVLRIFAVLNIMMLLVWGSADRQNASHLLVDWLMFSSLGLIALFVVSLFFPADQSRKTGKLTDVLFGLLAIAMVIFLAISFLPVI